MSPRVLLVVIICLAPGVARGEPRANDDEAYVGQLRERRQFEAAEKFCAERLRDARTPAAQRARWTIELARTLADHAAESPKSEQAALWTRARDTIDNFAARNPDHGQILLVRTQGALGLLAQGETRLQDADVESQHVTDSMAEARVALRNAINQFRKLDEAISFQTQLTNRPPRGNQGGALSLDELASLRLNVRYQLARALRLQGLSYPAGSADRTNSLAQAIDLLALLGQQDTRSTLSLSSRIDEITCLRLLGDLRIAETKMAELDKLSGEPRALQKVQAEKIRLLLAKGQVDDAAALAGRIGAADALLGDVRFARLEAFFAAWRQAREHGDVEQTAQWEKSTLDQVRAIERHDGPSLSRKAQALVGQKLEPADLQTTEAVVRVAQKLQSEGLVDKALAEYQRAEALARAESNRAAAFEIAFAAASLEKDRKNYRAASDRFRKLSLAATDDPRSSEAHLLAVHCAARLAQQVEPPKLDEYEKLLREHLATWPKSNTAAQAWWWLGRAREHEHAWQEAFRALTKVPSTHPQYAAAVEAAGRASQAMLADLRERGNANPELARDAVRHFEQVLATSASQGHAHDTAARAAILAVTPILLQDVAGGASQAESILNDALRAPNVPAAWKDSVRRLLVCALAAQGRTADAEELLRKLPLGSLDQSLSIVAVLEQMVGDATPQRGKPLAELTLVAIDRLLARRDKLDAPTMQSLTLKRAACLESADNVFEAVETLEALGETNPRNGVLQEEVASRLSKMDDDLGRHAALAKWRDIAGKSRPGTPRWFRAHFAMASAQFALGDKEQARSTIRIVQTSHPDFGDAQMKAKFIQLLAECELSGAQRGSR